MFYVVRTLRLVAEARTSQSVWTINGLDGTTFQLPVDEADANVARQHLTPFEELAPNVFVFGRFKHAFLESSSPEDREFQGQVQFYLTTCASDGF